MSLLFNCYYFFFCWGFAWGGCHPGFFPRDIGLFEEQFDYLVFSDLVSQGRRGALFLQMASYLGGSSSVRPGQFVYFYFFEKSGVSRYIKDNVIYFNTNINTYLLISKNVLTMGSPSL